jgi:glycerol uptake facilitator-like aquaporin
MDTRLRAYLAELVGVFLIVFIGGSAVCASFLRLESGQPRVELWGIALAEGFALAAVLPIAFRQSPGCLNPAVTLTFWVCKRLELRQMAILIVLQLLGSLLAGLAIRAIFPEEVLRLATPHLGDVLRNEDKQLTWVSLLTGSAVEALLTFFLTFAVFGFLIDRRANRFGGVAVGLARCALVLAGYNLTGAAANPVRWFGPALWQLTVEQIRTQWPLWDHPVYWFGPILGALAAGWVYSTFLLPPDQAKGTVP